MSRKVSLLLEKLAQTDVNSSEFIAVSKLVAEAFKEHTKKKLEKETKPKVVKIKPKRTIMCDDCSMLLLNNIKSILPPLEEPALP
jgi:hypothetical protein